MACTGQIDSHVLQRMQISGSIRYCLMIAMPAAMSMAVSESVEPHVFEVDGLAVDTHDRRRDPPGELAGLDHAAHQRTHEGAVVLGGQPLALFRVPFGLAHDATV